MQRARPGFQPYFPYASYATFEAQIVIIGRRADVLDVDRLEVSFAL